jgi:hypothetical protein
LKHGLNSIDRLVIDCIERGEKSPFSYYPSIGDPVYPPGEPILDRSLTERAGEVARRVCIRAYFAARQALGTVIDVQFLSVPGI